MASRVNNVNTRSNTNTTTPPIDTKKTPNNNNEPTIKDVMAKLNEVIRSIDYMSSQQEETLKRLILLENENKSLNEANSQLNTRLANIETFFFQQQQQQLQNHVTIHGIRAEQGEDLKQTIINTAKILNVDVTKESIISARRMNNNNNPNTPTIIVTEFHTTEIKNKILQNAKVNGPIMLNQLKNSPNNENKKIYINEYLNTYTKTLYENAKKLKLNNQYKFVWVKHGNIYIRKNETSNIIRVKHQNDVNRAQNESQ